MLSLCNPLHLRSMHRLQVSDENQTLLMGIEVRGVSVKCPGRKSSAWGRFVTRGVGFDLPVAESQAGCAPGCSNLSPRPSKLELPSSIFYLQFSHAVQICHRHYFYF